MERKDVDVAFYCADPVTNRKRLFEDALAFARLGKVLFILHDELEELPQLSQDLSLVNKQYMKMISFLYVKTLNCLLESLSSLPDWQNIPSTIILDDITKYCHKEKIQNACGVVAYLIDTARSCTSNVSCKLRVSVNEPADEDYCNALRDLYTNSIVSGKEHSNV